MTMGNCMWFCEIFRESCVILLHQIKGRRTLAEFSPTDQPTDQPTDKKCQRPVGHCRLVCILEDPWPGVDSRVGQRFHGRNRYRRKFTRRKPLGFYCYRTSFRPFLPLICQGKNTFSGQTVKSSFLHGACYLSRKGKKFQNLGWQQETHSFICAFWVLFSWFV